MFLTFDLVFKYWEVRNWTAPSKALGSVQTLSAPFFKNTSLHFKIELLPKKEKVALTKGKTDEGTIHLDITMTNQKLD